MINLFYYKTLIRRDTQSTKIDFYSFMIYINKQFKYVKSDLIDASMLTDLMQGKLAVQVMINCG